MKILILLWVQLLMFSFFTSSDTNTTSETYTLINATNLAKPNCPSRCGDVIIPYPFGIGYNTNCSIGHEFDVYCNNSTIPPKASFSEADYSSIKQISDSTVRISNDVATNCYLPNGTFSSGFKVWGNYKRSPYTLSEVNKFTVIGCDDYAWLRSRTKFRNVSTDCMVLCSMPEDVVGDQCSGNGCCQSSIPRDMISYRTDVNSMDDSDLSYTRSFNPCSYAFVGEENTFKFNGAADLNDTSLKKTIEAK
ncbi:hypothetical protein L6452_36809 [Arctium lappa]|uniref:Uncharacterized protein n=1 Tax=Arctium lappa TaxID=4217 RepID=A0ACB8Y151_ARCLA|nr:hypothetical protein L6452_36809 [Arctium lappa]